ncbi:MAG: hypothetical protein AAF787_14120 [Chloroflexota bacterium]
MAQFRKFAATALLTLLALSALATVALAVEETSGPPEAASGTGNLMLLIGVVAIAGIGAYMLRRGGDNDGEES